MRKIAKPLTPEQVGEIAGEAIGYVDRALNLVDGLVDDRNWEYWFGDREDGGFEDLHQGLGWLKEVRGRAQEGYEPSEKWQEDAWMLGDRKGDLE